MATDTKTRPDSETLWVRVTPAQLQMLDDLCRDEPGRLPTRAKMVRILIERATLAAMAAKAAAESEGQ